MKRFVTGVVFGALLGAALTYGLMRETTIELPQNAAAQDRSVFIEQRAKTDRTAVRSAERIASSPSAVKSGAEPIDAIAKQTSKSELDAVVSSNSAATRVASASDARSSSAEPIKLPDAFRAVLKLDESFAAEHTRLENQIRDPSWSYYMEQMLSGFFAARAPALGIEIVTISCRATACEILSFGESGGWMGVLLEQASKESWWDFDQWSGRGDDSGSRQAIVTILERRTSKEQRASNRAS